MDNDIEDLESLLSEHFGVTPVSTPWGSQEEVDVSTLCLDSDEDDHELDVDRRVQDYIDTLPDDTTGASVTSDSEGEAEVDCDLPQNDEDVNRITLYHKNGCGCKKNCIKQFTISDIFDHILTIREMEKQDKELYIMATVVNSPQNELTKRGKKRQKGHHDFSLVGKPVCRTVFMLTFDIKRSALQNILTHVDQHGVVQRIHGNKGKKPVKSLKFEDIKHAVTYVSQTAEDIGIPQPAAPRGSDNMPPVYLPSATTKLDIHKKYETSCLESEPTKRAVHYKTFCNIWKQCLPHIKIASPRDDVCATCEKLRKVVMDSRTEDEKLQGTANPREHIVNAQNEREVYNKCIAYAKGLFETGDRRHSHFTFDFSQNLWLPHHSRQIGPTYFMTLRKVQLFGVRNDGTSTQYNFLVDENETIGPDGTQTHGPNAVISMVDWVIERDHAEGPTISLHADNCPGQNKNYYMLGYLMWRVLSGRQEKIEYMMQIPGHARCHVDAGFARIKQLYRRTDTDALGQLTEVVNQSSSTSQCIRYPTWTWRDWKGFLKTYFKPLQGIRKYQYFRMSRDHPGMVKESCDKAEETFSIMKSNNFQFERGHLPQVLQPGGMSAARRRYLYSTVRPYVRPIFQDETCPGEP
ncbi:uncharacterized protein LOC132754508 isoform X3 [Ruditapes philippinarum]|uniref:uncharacterized protein LOC132754508 isoform X3 n=1 Tax=Ruditapes philippinarum TaxID=129788 RepID=UPI00295B0E22|nr:uncharacterized protein LOC132754508 isoform X3 [Ruditapes philippinarum]